jgi:hypothetical protein
MNINDFIDELITELAYRLDSGIPDLKNKQHLSVLSEILTEWGMGELENSLITVLSEDETNVKSPDDDKYSHKAYGYYVRKGDEEREDAQIYRKDGERYVSVSKDEYEEKAKAQGELGTKATGADTKSKTVTPTDTGDIQMGVAVNPNTVSGKQYVDNLPDGDPAKPKHGTVYPVGGGYYSDTPGGKPLYRKLVDESIAYIIESNADRGNVVVKQVKSSDGEVSNTPMVVVNTDSIDDTLIDLLGDDKVKAAINGIDVVLDNFIKDKDNPNSEDHIKVKNLMNKIFAGSELTDDEKKFLSQYVRIAKPSASKLKAAKYYITTVPNNFISKFRKKVEVGGRGVSTEITGKFREFTENAGLQILQSSVFGLKLTTPNQTFVDSANNTKLLSDIDGKPVASVERSNDGSVSKIIIGGSVIEKLDITDTSLSEADVKNRERSNRNMIEYATAIESGDMQFIDMDDGVFPNSAENRVIVIKHALGGMASRLTDLARSANVNDKSANEIINRLQKFSTKDPNDVPDEWNRELNSIISDLANHSLLKEAWANYAEIYSAIVDMHGGGKGTTEGAFVLLPESSTLKTVDLITLRTDSSDRKIVTLGGSSIKKEAGGASALTAKAEKSVYVNDTDGKKKELMVELSQSHRYIYNLKIDVDDIELHREAQSKYVDYIKEISATFGLDDDYMKSLEDELLTEGGRGYSMVNNALEVIKTNRIKSKLNADDETMEKLKLRLQNYYRYMEVSHRAYNLNVDVQDFINVSVSASRKIDIENKTVKLNASDGIDSIAYIQPAFNVGSWSNDGRSSNPGGGRFVHRKKGEFYKT